MSFELQTDRLHKENVIFSSRLNLLLIGESMLLVSYVSALNLDATTKSWILPALHFYYPKSSNKSAKW